MSSFKMTACCFYGLLLLKVSTIKKKKKSRRLRQREEVFPLTVMQKRGLELCPSVFWNTASLLSLETIPVVVMDGSKVGKEGLVFYYYLANCFPMRGNLQSFPTADMGSTLFIRTRLSGPMCYLRFCQHLGVPPMGAWWGRPHSPSPSGTHSCHSLLPVFVCKKRRAESRAKATIFKCPRIQSAILTPFENALIPA